MNRPRTSRPRAPIRILVGFGMMALLAALVAWQAAVPIGKRGAAATQENPAQPSVIGGPRGSERSKRAGGSPVAGGIAPASLIALARVWGDESEEGIPDAATAEQAWANVMTLKREETRARVEDAYASEDRDSNWAMRAEADLRESLEELLPEGSRLLHAECRKTLCAVEVAHRERAESMLFLRALVEERPWRGAIYTPAPLADDKTLTTTVYMSREDHPIPAASD